jgi:hypothetical protein
MGRLFGILALALGGALLAAVERLKTGVAALDRLEIRLGVLGNALVVFGPSVLMDATIPRVLVGLVHAESGGDQRQYLGDTMAPSGPAVGPMQVTRGTALILGWWRWDQAPLNSAAERAAYAALATDEEWGIAAGVRVFADKLKTANGNIPEAIRRYNGAGEEAAKYANRVMAWLKTTYGMTL